MSRQVNDAILIPSNEVIADDIVLADGPQMTNSDDQRTLVTAEADNCNNKKDSNSNSDEYKPPKFNAIKEFLGDEEGLDIYQLVAFRIKSGNGCCTCRKKQNIDENDKKQPQCLDYHGLKYHTTIDDRFTCDGCDKSITENTELWGCRECDYDLCKECYDTEIEKSNREIASCWGYYMDIIKAVICCFTQFSSIFVLYFYTVEMKEESDRTWCDNTETHVAAKLMAISYAFFLSLIFHLKLDGQRCGFYVCIDYGERDHSFISSDWLRFGFIINRLLLLNVFYLSFLIIFFSTDPLDIILNCVALFFLLDIDNEVIDSADYKKTLEWFENEENIKSCKSKKFNKWRRWFDKIELCVNLILFGSAMIGIVVVPFVVAVCY